MTGVLKRMSRRCFILGGALVLGLCHLSGSVSAQEITLRAANAFQEGTYFARNFEAFIKKVNEEGKGLVRINYIGGPKAIPTFELANAIRTGVVDLGNTTTSYTASIVPEGLSLNYTELSMAELRNSGVIDYLNKMFLQKGLYYFARTGEGIRYHIYTNKLLNNGEVSKLKLRSAPLYRDFFERAGINGVQLAAGEMYTALANGVIDGYAWPLIGIFDFNWQEQTKYRVEPGFYALELGVLFNANTWKKLTPEQRAFLEKQAVWLESMTADAVKADAVTEIKRQKDAGIRELDLGKDQRNAFLKMAYDSAWDAVVKLSPEHGPKLRKMMAPSN